jgi:phosphonate transport system substrate-binding protein
MRTLANSLGVLLLAVGAAAAPAEPSPRQRFGVVSVYTPRVMYLKYQPLTNYLESATGNPWDLVLVASYEKEVEDLCAGKLTMAYLGPYTYARARAACPVIPVAKLYTRGKPTYRGLIMVRVDSKLQRVEDLAGKAFGFGEPMSTASCLVARAMLEDAGLRVGVNLACRHYSHHEQAARAVLLGEVDACAVRDIVGEKFVARQALRILARSDEIPNFVLVLGPGAPPALREQLTRVLTVLPGQDRAIAAAMKGWDEELSGGFVPASDEEYEPIRTLARRVFGPLALTLSDAAMRKECPPARP